MMITYDHENPEDLAEVSLRKVVAIAHSRGRDQEIPEDIAKPEASLLHRVLVVVEGVSLVLQEIHEPSGPEEKPEEVGEELE